MREVRYELMRPGEILAEMAACPLVYVPLGPLEWHGPHLPLGTDPLIAYAVATRAAQRTGGVVLPPFFWGSERERSRRQLEDIGFHGDEWIIGMDFPANALKSLYCREEYLALLLRELLELLVRQGYRLIVIVNGHGGRNHMAVLDRLAAELTAQGPARVLNILAWARQGADKPGIGHGCSDETSVMMALWPESVDLAALPPLSEPLGNVDWGIVDSLTFRGLPAPDFTVRDDPRASTRQQGEADLHESVEFVVQRVQQALSGE